MSTPSGSLSFDAARESMDVLRRQLDAFVEAWETTRARRTSIRSSRESGEIRRLTLVELIKVDLEYRWLSRGCPKRISEYFAEFPELVQDQHSVRPDLRRIPYSQAKRAAGRRRRVSARVSRPHGRDCVDPQHRAGVRNDGTFSSGEAAAGREIAAGDTIDDFELLSEAGGRRFCQGFSCPAEVDATDARRQDLGR